MSEAKLRFADRLVIWSSITMSLVPLVPFALEGVI